jgi:hypothetical protein
MANDEMSRPINFKMFSPRKRKRIIMRSEVKVAFSEWMLPAFLLISIITGMDPTISITAKRIIEMVKIFLKLMSILK